MISWQIEHDRFSSISSFFSMVTAAVVVDADEDLLEESVEVVVEVEFLFSWGAWNKNKMSIFKTTDL